MNKIITKQFHGHWLLATVLFSGLLGTGCSSSHQAGSPTAEKNSNQYHSKSDFVPGTQVLWQETFATAKTGDLPKGWNTNAGAEVVEKDNGEKALLLTKDGVYLPTGVNLPNNFTLEFTVTCSANYSFYSSPLQIMFAQLSSKKEFTVLKQYNPHNKDVVKVSLHPMNAASNAGSSTIELFEKGSKQSENEIGTKAFFAKGGPATVKVSIWRQGERLRVYLNQEKIWDLPQAFSSQSAYNSLIFGISHLVDKTGKYYLSDIRLATETTSTAVRIHAR
ncbi:MAG TPA: hypothetical protein VHK91_00940 [Flavisolibacter sp.]|nr:hypothetical protein [Flavisolibacter sp.]